MVHDEDTENIRRDLDQSGQNKRDENVASKIRRTQADAVIACKDNENKIEITFIKCEKSGIFMICGYVQLTQYAFKTLLRIFSFCSLTIISIRP